MNFLTDNAQQCGISKQFETLRGTETHSFQEYVFQKVDTTVSLSMKVTFKYEYILQWDSPSLRRDYANI